MPEQLRIEVAQEQDAVALVHELFGRFRPELTERDAGWELHVPPSRSADRLLVDLLNALPASMHRTGVDGVNVVVDGHRYRINRPRH